MSTAELRASLQAARQWHRETLPRLEELDQSLRRLTHTPRLIASWIRFFDGLGAHIQEEEATIFPGLDALAAGRAVPEALILRLAELQHEQHEVSSVAEGLRAVAPAAGLWEEELLAFLDALEQHAVAESALFSQSLALLAEQAPEVVRETRGVCSTCLRDVPAAVAIVEGSARLQKRCPEHGLTEQLLSNAPDYWRELDRFYFKVNAQSWPQRDYIVRMTERCNLDCPICLARANTRDSPDLELAGLEELLSARRGIKVDLMAAEPTLRDDLEDWIRRVKQTGNIAALHTNGLKLAHMAYARKLKEAGVDEVFLQFDGFDEDANRVLRGRPLLKARMAALSNLRALDIATSLIVVVARDLNEREIGKTLNFALQPENSHIREVFFLGLRMLGSAAVNGLAESAMMPDELIDQLCDQEPSVTRDDIRRFNKLYFALLSAFQVKKCLYVQHYLMARGSQGAAVPASELLDLEALEAAADRYAATFTTHPRLAKARLLVDMARASANSRTARVLLDLVRLQDLMRTGMNLQRVPRRFLLLGFITACDPENYDAQVSINCGKGELSVDGGFMESGADANVARERRPVET